MASSSLELLLSHFGDTVSHDDQGAVTVHDVEGARPHIDRLVRSAVFSGGLEREQARWLIWEIAQAAGVYAASIHDLYLAIGRGDAPQTFTVPAVNVRGMNYYMSRALYRTAIKLDAGALICEIARSEMAYTDQRPAEYVAVVLAAAVREGFRGPVFIQGDHFQISASRYAADADREVAAVRELMDEAVAAGFYNIDIDTSTLVGLAFDNLDEQQRTNYELCAALTEHVRGIEPDGVTISLGGEIGEVGGHNSTVEELHAFMQGYNRTLPDGVAGISKISVQTGTSHGGVVLPDGTLADVTVDFDTLGELSRLAREEYGLGGAVQHGASTLPIEAFGRFPEIGTVEIHLATGFQNIIFDHAPEALVEQAYEHCRVAHADEWKEGKTEEQFLYSTRKKAFGALKEQWWNVDEAGMARIQKALEEQFETLFTRLNIGGTADLARQFVPHVPAHRPLPTEAVEEKDLEIASDLAD